MRFLCGCLLFLAGAAVAFVTFAFTAMGLTPQDSSVPATGVDVGAVVVGSAASVLLMAAGAALAWRVLSGR